MWTCFAIREHECRSTKHTRPLAMMTGSVMISSDIGQRKSFGIIKDGHFSRYFGIETSPRMFFSSMPAISLNLLRSTIMFLVLSCCCPFLSLMSFLMAIVSALKSARLCSSSFLASLSNIALSAFPSSLFWIIIIKSMESSMSWVSDLFLHLFNCAFMSSIWNHQSDSRFCQNSMMDHYMVY